MKTLKIDCGSIVGAILAGLVVCLVPAAALASPCVSGNAIRVGQSIDLTGPQHWVGSEFSQGAQLLLRRINRNGGINGRSIEMTVMDDQSDTKVTAENVKKLILAERSCVIFGPMGADQTVAAVNAASGVAVVAPVTGTESVHATTGGKAFFVRGTYGDEVQAIVKHARAVGFKRFALVYPNDTFGTPILPVYEEIVRKEGGTSVRTISVQSVDTTDFGATVQALRQVQADVVIAYLSQTFPEFLAAYREGGVSGQLYTISVAYGTKMMGVNSDHLRGLGVTQTTPSPWGQTKPVVREFLAEQRSDSANVPLSFAAIEGYIGAKLMVEALKRAGREPTSESVRQALRDMPRTDIGGFSVPSRSDGKVNVEIGVLDQQGRYRR